MYVLDSGHYLSKRQRKKSQKYDVKEGHTKNRLQRKVRNTLKANNAGM